MTNREMFLLAASILFASTTLGLALKGTLHKGPHKGPDHGRPGFERPFEGHGPHGGKDRKRPDFFAMGDVNKDGVITKEELLAKQTERLEEFFTTVDTNKDGKLTREEMDAGRKLMKDKMKARFEAERAAAPAAPEAK